MDKLTQTQWDELNAEEQIERAGEKPEAQTPSVEDLQKQIADNDKKIKDMEETHKRETSGLVEDARLERKRRQDIEDLNKPKGEKKDLLEGRTDDDIVTVGDVKKMRTEEAKDRQSERVGRLKERAAERMDTDEERMQDKTAKASDRYPIPYDEALKAWDELVRKDPKLWDDIHREALRPGGKPAEKMYRIAIEEHPDIRNKAKVSEREKIIAELEREGKIPKRISGGGAGDGVVDLANMSDAQLLKLAETNSAALDKAMGKT